MANCHVRVGYEQIFADFAARKIDQISQWRGQLEIVEVDGAVLRAVVPPDRGFTSDFAVARRTYVNAFANSRLPDESERIASRRHEPPDARPTLTHMAIEPVVVVGLLRVEPR